MPQDAKYFNAQFVYKKFCLNFSCLFDEHLLSICQVWHTEFASWCSQIPTEIEICNYYSWRKCHYIAKTNRQSTNHKPQISCASSSELTSNKTSTASAHSIQIISHHNQQTHTIPQQQDRQQQQQAKSNGQHVDAFPKSKGKKSWCH